MSNVFDKFAKGLKTPLSGFGINTPDAVVAQISKNLTQPVGSSASALNRIYGSEDDFMRKYENFNNVYKRSLTKELDSTAVTVGQRRMIQSAIDSPSINLNLIRNVKERQMLTSMLRNQILDVGAMVENFGAPGVALPSSNMYRVAGKYMVDQRGKQNHPVLSLINSLTFNIDPTKSGVEAFGFGRSNLPSVSSLRTAFEQSKKMGASPAAGVFDVGGKANYKIFTFDVETSGLGIYDQVRSLAASTMEIQHGTTFRQNADGFSTHFITPQMQEYSVGGSSGSTTRLGTKVYGLEKKPGDLAADLTTAEGRREAANIYKKFFQQATQADVVAGHNVQFDVQRILMSVSGLDEFYQDKDAVTALNQFQKMMDSGKVVNSLDVARDYLTRQALDAAEAVSGDEVAKTQKLLSTMFAPETLARASTGGAATPFSIGNIAAQTNLLELVESKGGTVGSELVRGLAGGAGAAHQADVDTNLTNFMMRFIHTGELKFGFGAMTGSDVSLARKTILKSSAITPTTNIANVQHMSDAVYNFATSEEGMKGAKLSTDQGIISFSKGGFFEAITDGVTGEVQSRAVPEASALSRIQQALEASRRGGQSELLDTGITYGQASRADRMLANVSKSSAISRSTQSLLSGLDAGDQAVEDAFIDALAGTREFLGFNDYQYRPDILMDKGMTNLISKTYGVISDTDADNYLTKLASGGISAAIDDPYMRRNFVELATITSSMPFTRKAEGYTGGLASQIVSRVAGKAQGVGPLSAGEHAARVAEFNSNVGVKVGEYLSEIGVSFADAQTSNYLIGKSGEISRPAISAKILKEIDVSVTDSSGVRGPVKFLSQEFLSNYSVNKFGLSVNEREGGRFVNLVFGDLGANTNAGQRVVSRKMSLQIASGIVEQMQTRFAGKNAAKLVEEGFFENENQAGETLRRLRGDKAGVKAFRKDLARSISDRGLTVGSIGGREAEGVVSLLEQLGSSIDNDVVAFQKGMQFAMSEYGDDFVAFQGRVGEKELAILKANNPALAKEIEEGKFFQRAYQTYTKTMEKATEDVPFRKKLQRAFSSKGLDKGMFGTRFGRNLRDAQVRATYKKYAPKVGVGVAAVGLLSAGYYIAKKNRENNLYDEVMREQPKEGRGSITASNDQLIQMYPQSSTRRDPLVTAGVVGSLDRNKIGHSGMGPNKYDHLYR